MTFTVSPPGASAGRADAPMDRSQGRRLPACARYAGCDARVESRNARGILFTHRCPRRARYVLERSGQDAMNACPAHALEGSRERGPRLAPSPHAPGCGTSDMLVPAGS